MMAKNYGRLAFDERIEIEKLLSHKKSYADIAAFLVRSKSTVSREVNKQGRDNHLARCLIDDSDYPGNCHKTQESKKNQDILQ